MHQMLKQAFGNVFFLFFTLKVSQLKEILVNLYFM